LLSTLLRPTTTSLFTYTTLFRSNFRAQAKISKSGQRENCSVPVLANTLGSSEGVTPRVAAHICPKRRKVKKNGEKQKFFRERARSEEHTSELQSRENLVCRLLFE